MVRLMSTSPDQVRKALPGDANTLAPMLARAFDDDPLATWMFPEAVARKKRLPRLFAALFGVTFPLGEVYTTKSLRAAAFWNPPGTFPLGWRTNARMGLTMTRILRQRLMVCAPGLMYFDTHHPREPHWYLQMLGTDPEFRGKDSARRSSTLSWTAATGPASASTSKPPRNRTSPSTRGMALPWPRRCRFLAGRSSGPCGANRAEVYPRSYLLVVLGSA